MKPSRSYVCLLFFLTFIVLPFSRAHAFNNRTPIDISADMIEYADADQAITAEGHVVVTQGSATLKADWMRYEQGNQRLYARDHVFMSDQGAVMFGDTLAYDLLAESGTVTGTLGYDKPWLFSGAEWRKNLDYFVGHDMSFTSCDLVHPHYHVRSHSVHLVPGQYFWAWNNVAYADTVPVFYSPFIYKNLEKRRVVVHLEPGHDTVNGNFLKTQTTLRLTDQIYDKVLYDYYSEQGSGIGNEFNYQIPGKIQGSLFAYYIDPHGDPSGAGAPTDPQYNLRAYHWQRLNPTSVLQSNVNLRKNVSFNNQYFPQDTNQAVNDIDSSVALTNQKGHVNQRLVVEALQAPDVTDTSAFPDTHIQTASLPRYDFTFYQVPLWKPAVSTAAVAGLHAGPVMFNANASLGETYERLDDLMHANGLGSFTLSQAIPLTRQWSFTPTLTPQMNWQDRFDAEPPPPVIGSSTPVTNVGLFRGFQGRLGTADTLRWRPLSALTLDQTFSLTARLEPNGMALDRGPSDGGIETNHLGELVFWRPSRRVLMRTFSGYDFRSIADEPPQTYEQRKWDPWTTEYTLEANRQSEYFARYELGFFPTRSLLWEGDYRYHGPYNTLLETGLLYNEGTSGVLTWNNHLGLFLSPGWRVDLTIHSFVPNGSINEAFNKASMIDDEFIVTRDMHCWQAQFVYRNIPPLARSYSLQFNLKLGVAAEKDITNHDLESQYYPWRAKAYAN